jgi:hypothetical protein
MENTKLLSSRSLKASDSKVSRVAIMSEHQIPLRVTEHSIDRATSLHLSDDEHRQLTLLDRLGWTAILSLLVGAGLILGCMGFICFLWLSDEENSVWRRIVMAGWITRSITIAALLVRWAVTTQAAICTSMVASLFLNSFQVPLPNVAAISLMRFSNTGPHSLLLSLPRPPGTQTVLLGIIVFVMAVVTFSLQFISTALLSNVGTGIITDFRISPNLSYGINSNSLLVTHPENAGSLGIRPAMYPAFLEFAVPPILNESVDNVRDTGLSIRGFIPIGDESARKSITNYAGMATLIDTRVICTQPVFSKSRLSPVSRKYTISGYISTDFTVPRFNRTSKTITEAAFNCSWAIQGSSPTHFANNAEWPLTLCKLNITDNGLISEMDPLILPRSTKFNPGSAFLLINSTGTYSDWGQSRDTVPITAIRRNGIWLEILTNATKLSLQATLCYTSPVLQDTSITAWRNPNNVSEVLSSWHNETGTFDTRAIRKQLGATTILSSPTERGVFQLIQKTSWQRPPVNYNTAGGWITVRKRTVPSSLTVYAMHGLDTPESAVCMCGYCACGSKGQVSRLNAAVFNDIVRETGNPALAVQGLITTLHGMAYYDRLFQFDVNARANITSNISVIKPTGWAFFSVVIAVTSLHLVLVLFVVVLFVFTGGNCLLNNAWSTVAQLQSPETKEWLEVAIDMKDRNVKKAMVIAGEDSVLVGIGRAKGDLRVRRGS